jgi:hypothetical protein
MNRKNILTALKNGNIPKNNAKELCIGRDKEIQEFEDMFEEIKNGKSYTKFVSGEFGAGKSFFLKVIEESAFKEDFVVSWITIGHDMPFHKIDIVYKNIAKSLRCKTGTSLNHIIDRWITRLKVEAADETDDPDEQKSIVKNNIMEDLELTRDYSNPFATAVEKYYELKEDGDIQSANYAQAWLRGDSNIPFSEKKKFGVKGGIEKENTFDFLSALPIFIRSIGYSGLVILIDEAEFIMRIPMQKSRDVAYNYLRDIYDKCSDGELENTLFLFAGTPQFFDDDNVGVQSYAALYNRISDAIETEYDDMRKPVMDLKGFDKKDLKEISSSIISMHSEEYEWDTSNIEKIIDDFIDIHEKNSSITGGQITPRLYFRSLVSVLDIVEQNQDQLSNKDEILKLFVKEEEDKKEDEDDLYDDW